MKYNLVSMGDQENLTLFHDGQMYVASNTHPNWNTIKQKVVVDNDPDAVNYFDVQASIVQRFDRLTETVTIENGVLCLDGDPVDGSLSKKILEYVENGTEDWKPLAAFLEKVQSNPSQNSKEQLYQFLDKYDYEILPDGDILGYKGVYKNKDGDESYHSIHFGTASVNDIEQSNSRIKQSIGDVVTMPRSAVSSDGDLGCSTGLHVSDFSFASRYGDAVLAVAVNPRDVVSVPYREAHKVRVCRYTILGEVTYKGEWQEQYNTDYDEAVW